MATEASLAENNQLEVGCKSLKITIPVIGRDETECTAKAAREPDRKMANYTFSKVKTTYRSR